MSAAEGTRVQEAAPVGLGETVRPERTDRIAAALRRADYMNWSAAEVAEKIAGTVEALIREAIEAERDRIRGAVRISRDPRPIFTHVDAYGLGHVLKGEPWSEDA